MGGGGENLVEKLFKPASPTATTPLQDGDPVAEAGNTTGWPGGRLDQEF